MSIWSNPGKVVDNWTEWFKDLFESLTDGGDIKAIMRGFFVKTFGEDGGLIFDECWEAVDQLEAGKKFGDVAEELLNDLTTKSASLAETELGKVLLIIQLAMQVAKTVKGIFTDSDKQVVASVTPSPSPQPAS